MTTPFDAFDQAQTEGIARWGEVVDPVSYENFAAVSWQTPDGHFIVLEADPLGCDLTTNAKGGEQMWLLAGESIFDDAELLSIPDALDAAEAWMREHGCPIARVA